MEFDKEMVRDWERSHRRGKVAGGLLLVVAGVLFLMRELEADIPDWIFSWKTLLIGIGIVGFIKHGFRRLFWTVPVLVGTAFLLTDMYPDLHIKPILWPVLIILIGLFMMFRPRKRYHQIYQQRCAERKYYREYGNTAAGRGDNEDFIDSTSVMGGIEKKILSKNFRGGDITNVFGGTEIDLSQADFEGKANLEVTQIFGGCKLIVPSNWQIRSNVVTVMGSIEDKRTVKPSSDNDNGKILVLNGTAICGGIEIKSF